MCVCAREFVILQWLLFDLYTTCCVKTNTSHNERWFSVPSTVFEKEKRTEESMIDSILGLSNKLIATFICTTHDKAYLNVGAYTSPARSCHVDDAFIDSCCFVCGIFITFVKWSIAIFFVQFTNNFVLLCYLTFVGISWSSWRIVHSSGVVCNT